MAFVKAAGGKKRYKAVFEITSKGATEAKRRQELESFEKGLHALAKKHLGKVEKSK